MKRAYFIFLFLCVSTFLCLTTALFAQSNTASLISQTARVAAPISAPQADRQAQARILDGYGKLPLSFEANHGQADARVKFLSRTGAYSLFLTGDEAVFTWSGHKAVKHNVKIGTAATKAGGVVRIKLRHANPAAKVMGVDELAGTSNYFIGNDPAKWRTNVPTYAKVKYEGIYPGIDLIYYGNQRQLEYDFVLQPGASPLAIRLGIAGAKRLRLERGDLVLTSAGGDLHLRSPHIYQEANGVRRQVRGGYVIKSKSEVGFEVAAYDRRRALVIDPVLAYSTYLGGSNPDNGNGIAVDSAGNAYVTGGTYLAHFPTANAIQPVSGGLWDAFVSKINADGTALVYSTYLGGSGTDEGFGITVDSVGNAYVTGLTQSTNFPTANALQPTNHGFRNAFVTKINASGTALVYSTYLGGSVTDEGGSVADEGHGIAVDSSGNAYVTGGASSTDFPTANAIQPTNHGSGDAFVTKFNASGSALVYSTYLGGSGGENGSGIAADSAGNAYVTGWTESSDFPTANAIQPVSGGLWDAFVTKINADGTALVYSTYLGGSNYDEAYGIAVDPAGNAYVTGETESSDFPTANAIQPTNGGEGTAFVTKINANGTALVYSTYLGGSGGDAAYGIAADTAGDAYVTGKTFSTDFPTVNALQPTNHGYPNAFVTKINANGGALVYSTYLGGKSEDFAYGIAADSAGSAYVTGLTYSATFPITALAFERSRESFGNAFIAKIASQTFVNVPTKPAFPVQVVGTTSAAKKFTVTNQGSDILTINKIYIGGLDPGDFAETNTCGPTLAANASCTISVTFTPSAKNARKAGLGISSSDPASPDAVALSGIGADVSLSKKNLSFGDQQVGTTSAPQGVTLTNLGGTQLNFTAISITGTNAGDFSETNTCGTSIAAKASCTITVTFTPTATGTRKAGVSIKDNGGGSPQVVSLTGTGN